MLLGHLTNFLKISKNNNGVSLIGLLIASSLLGIFLLGFLNFFQIQSKSQKNIERRFLLNNLMEEIRYILSDRDVCEGTFKDINPTNNSGWTSNKIIKDSTGSSIFYEVGKKYYGLELLDIKFTGFSPLGPNPPRKYEGFADLSLEFKMGPNMIGPQKVVRKIRLRAETKGDAFPGEEYNLKTCSSPGAMPACPEGDIYVSYNGKVTCSSDAGLAMFSHYERHKMPCNNAEAVSAGGPWGGEQCATKFALVTDLEVDDPTIEGGFKLYQKTYTAKTDGQIKINAFVPIRYGSQIQLELAILGSLWVTNNSTGVTQLAGLGDLINPWSKIQKWQQDPPPALTFSFQDETIPQYPIAPDPGVFQPSYAPCCSMGGSGQVIGVFDAIKDETYTIKLYILKRTAFEPQKTWVNPGRKIWLGTLKFFDHFVDGYMELTEITKY